MGFLGFCRGGQTRGFTVSLYLNYACRNSLSCIFFFFKLTGRKNYRNYKALTRTKM